jgi:hypothetical protein
MPHDLIPLAGSNSLTLPALFAPDPSTARRVLEFFTANIRNPRTRKTYGDAAGEFAAWCEGKAISHLRDVQPFHVAAYVEELQQLIASALRQGAARRHPLSGPSIRNVRRQVACNVQAPNSIEPFMVHCTRNGAW